MATAKITLEDKYTVTDGRILISGVQALTRLTLMQRRRDLAAGHNTAGYVSGYRGSPLGTVDTEFWRAAEIVEDHHVKFQAGVNEDLAATAIWGSQQTNLFEGAKYDGVFAMWYGKGPGVDRSGDAFRHGNLAGTSPLGGVLVIAGDDPSCMSSTVASQSEVALIDAQFPVLNPSTVQDVLDFGIRGWAMSRYAGCWVSMKTTSELMDSSATVDVGADRNNVTLPTDFDMPPDGLHIRWPDSSLDQERRLRHQKLEAAKAFARANPFDRIVVDSPNPRIGIATTGKSYPEVMQALADFGIGDDAGVRVYKIGLTWPLEQEGLRRFANGLDEIFVIEEKRPIIEPQIKEILYDLPSDNRPRVVGSTDETCAELIPSYGVLSPAQITEALADRLSRYIDVPSIQSRLDFVRGRIQSPAASKSKRTPYFCSGCPHNTSTLTPEGTRTLAGIGCHTMAIWMDRENSVYTHMGAEGANWLGQAPFTETDHVFTNIGDGTYFHSGLLALRAAVAGGVNMTYKILYNDAVALTGGQPMDGPLDVPMITRQVRAEGAGRIIVVSDEPDKYPLGADFASGVTIHHRDELDELQRNLRHEKGISVLVYDQTCAAEKRRRRKRGEFPDPPRRVFINEAVCEGCGDCGRASNCVSLVPVETEFGRKRAIDQSACNKDYSCLNGFCPALVTVHGGALHKRAALAEDETVFPPLPEPEIPNTATPYGIAIAGIGGTGVVTIGALLATAAHMENKAASLLEITGMAQKNGAVFAHLRIGDKANALHALRLGPGSANLLLGCDLVASAGEETLAALTPGQSSAVVNRHETMTPNFLQSPDLVFPGEELVGALENAAGSDRTHVLEATKIATALLGDSIATNLFLVGFAYQKGLIPLHAASIDAAIELNGVAVDFNRNAFIWGRHAAHDGDWVKDLAGFGTDQVVERKSIVDHRADELIAYQDEAYAARYRALVTRTQQAEDALGKSGLADAVARSYFKLLAYKDEYEVARLFTERPFQDKLRAQFDGEIKLSFHLAPPWLANRDLRTGEPRKKEFGSWMMRTFRVLAKFKNLRGTPFDPFGRLKERRTERRLITEFEALMDDILANLSADNFETACDLAANAQSIRGFGHVNDKSIAKAKTTEQSLLTAFRSR
ncbi:MAG: indolepyruvate ferredoxin oxidoreductase family protein [Rhodospirillaceae bacterium]|nr:indolepyruvate ferredoxin oxidoreductase family protein [Rhodospirillaceae bacterium]